MIKFKWNLCLMLILNFVIIGAAGPNSNAHVFIDYDVNTEEVENETKEAVKDTDYFISIFAENTQQLFSYSVKIEYNKEILVFENAASSLSSLGKSFIESNKGKAMNLMSFPYKEGIEIATSLQGEDESVAVSGNGVLGYLKFKGKSNGNPEIKITEIKLVTINGTVDSISTDK